jgi:hypothetical protein
MPNFAKNKGADVAEAQAKSGREGVDYFSVKEGNEVFVRPLTDMTELITVQVHMGVPTKPGPKNANSWPQQMSAVCQNDPAFVVSGEGEPVIYEDGYGDCYIHRAMQDVKGKFGGSVAKPRAQTWGLFALREPVKEEGKLIGFRDIMENFTDPDGHVHSIPKIVVASQSWGNFWGAFVSAAFMSGSICGMDFNVRRTGQAEYTISPGRETDHKPGAGSWKPYTDALALRGLSVEEVITGQASPKYYGRFFDPSVSNEDDGAATEQPAGAAAAAVSPEVAAETRGRMAAAFGTTQPT